MAPFSAVKSDTSPQCPNTSCRGAAIRFIEIDHCRRGKPAGAFLALEPIPPLELLALLREENWGSGLIQINDSSSVLSVADIARPRVNDADEIVFGLEQSIAVTATNCYVQRRLARCQEHQLGWGWINHSRLGQYGWRRRRQWLSKKSQVVVQKMQVKPSFSIKPYV